MPFFLFLFCNQKKRKERRRKKKKNMQMFPTPSLRSVVFFFLLRKISYARYCHCVTRSQGGGKYKMTLHRRRVRSTVAGERVPVYRQQPFNLTPVRAQWLAVLSACFSFFFFGVHFSSFFCLASKRKKKKGTIRKFIKLNTSKYIFCCVIPNICQARQQV